MSASNSANFPLLVSRNSAREGIAHALRLYVGRGRRYSVKRLSNGSGVPDRLIEAAMCEPDDPDYRQLTPENLLSLMAFLGAGFASEVLEMAHLGAFELPDEEMPPPGALVADCASDTAEVAERAADGKFDGNDRRALKIVGHRHIERGMKMVAMSAPRRDHLRSVA